MLSGSRFNVIIIGDYMIIQNAPRRSLCCSIEALSSFSTKNNIKSQYPCIAEDHASRVNIHASRKIMHHESIPMHHESIFMYRGKSCIGSQYSIAKDHASRVNIQASREDSMPRRNLCIARRFHISQKFMHHEKIPCLVEINASLEDFMSLWN